MLIENCGLSVQTTNTLLRGGFDTVEKLYDFTNRYGRNALLRTVRWFGKTAMKELMENENTKCILDCKVKFDSKKFEKDKVHNSKLNKIEHIRFLEKQIEELLKQIEELQEELW